MEMRRRDVRALKVATRPLLGSSISRGQTCVVTPCDGTCGGGCGHRCVASLLKARQRYEANCRQEVGTASRLPHVAIDAESEAGSECKRPERQEKVANKLMHEATTAKVRAGGPNSIAKLLAEFFPKLQGAHGRIEMALATNRSEIGEWAQGLARTSAAQDGDCRLLAHINGSYLGIVLCELARGVHALRHYAKIGWANSASLGGLRSADKTPGGSGEHFNDDHERFASVRWRCRTEMLASLRIEKIIAKLVTEAARDVPKPKVPCSR